MGDMEEQMKQKTKKTACINGNCNCLFCENDPCDYRRRGHMSVCDFMNQVDGRCLHKVASAPKKRRTANTNNDVFYRQSCETFAAHEHDKNNRQYLPFRE